MMQRRRVMSLLLAFALVLGMAMQTRASSIEETKKKGEALEAEKSAAEAEKAALAEQLNTLIEEMDATAAKISAKQEEIAVKETELIQAQIDENNQYESMKKRIKYMYENGNSQFVEILFESKSIGDFLNNAEYITQISEYDRDMLVEFQNTVKRVNDQKIAMEKEKAELEALQVQLQEKEKEITALLEEKAEQISDLEAAIGENAAKLKALQEEAARQERMRKEAEEAAKRAAAQNAQSASSGGGTPGPSYTGGGGGGQLGNPCPAAYISSEFGGRSSPGGIGSTNHKGRDYAAAEGSAIYAAAGGVVTTVGYSGARGNYIVVNHGNISTLYQHCSAIYASPGQSVGSGQNIAAVGNTGASTGPHLHFEVWVGGVPVDPRGYL